MTKNQLTLIGLTILAIAAGGWWWLMKDQPLEPAVVLPEVVQPAQQQQMKHQQRLMDDQINKLNQQQLALQQRLKTERTATELPQVQHDLTNRIANLPEPDSLRGTVPSDVSGRRISGQDTASGVPIKVLNNYQTETGISSERVEELMNR